MSKVYSPGIGVSREIVSLPAFTILTITDALTGMPFISTSKEATATLNLETAELSTYQEYTCSELRIGITFKERVETTIDAHLTNSLSIFTIDENALPRKIRISFGIDNSASNEYLGTESWLISKCYRIAGSAATSSGIVATIETPDTALIYHAALDLSVKAPHTFHTWHNYENSCGICCTASLEPCDVQEIKFKWGVEIRNAHTKTSIETKVTSAGRLNHEKTWINIWDNHDVDIQANGGPIELGMKYALFHLLQHSKDVHKTDSWQMSPARGLTSAYHSGAVFFDSDLHKCIFWIWNDPDVALAMIRYRYKSLTKAKEFAKSTGFEGARYPEAANDIGQDNGPHLIMSYASCETIREWSVKEVLHISSDVAYSVAKYYEVTKHHSFMLKEGVEILTECAKFAASALKWSPEKSGYVAESVMGPDEYHYHTNNNYYTNYMFKWCLNYAAALPSAGFVLAVDMTEIENWLKIADKIYFPEFRVNGVEIPEEFEGYSKLCQTETRNSNSIGPRFINNEERHAAQKLENFNTQIVKQADIILLMSLFPAEFSLATKKASFDYYEPRTIHESSLSFGPHAVVSSHIGYISRAADFVAQAARYNLDFTQPDRYTNGLHLSAYAGAWQGLVEGLAGLILHGDNLSFLPRLPPQWTSYTFQISFRGSRFIIKVTEDFHLEVWEGQIQVPTTRTFDGRYHLGRIGR
jgi:trehalose/maltose hydrolase-like predicted phosphorylase